ncbi:hypothetical protein SHYC_05265 [Staphylococcus hyicus]|nr:hypothetical protein SHYC_05265 [Staphylococcus hyicus]SQE47307.1 Uncharacterised protein [Staphylococcus hyicus]
MKAANIISSFYFSLAFAIFFGAMYTPLNSFVQPHSFGEVVIAILIYILKVLVFFIIFKLIFTLVAHIIRKQVNNQH